MQVRSVKTASNVYKPPAKLYSVAEALAALKLNSKLKVTLRDTPANISGNLNALKTIQSQISSTKNILTWYMYYNTEKKLVDFL